MSKQNGDLFVVVTRHVNDKGTLITHAYGAWTQRKTAMKHKQRFQALPGVDAVTCKIINANPSA